MDAHFSSLSYKQNRIDAAIVLGVVSDLCILAPDHLAAWSDQPQLRDIDFDNGTLGDDAKAGVCLSIGVFLDADDLQLECSLQLWVRHMSLGHAQACRPDKPFVFRGFPREPRWDEGHLCGRKEMNR